MKSSFLTIAAAGVVALAVATHVVSGQSQPPAISPLPVSKPSLVSKLEVGMLIRVRGDNGGPYAIGLQDKDRLTDSAGRPLVDVYTISEIGGDHFVAKIKTDRFEMERSIAFAAVGEITRTIVPDARRAAP